MSRNLPQIAAAAFAAQKATGCPGLLLIAQCALETGWLSSVPQNNCFGIKDYPGAYGRQMLKTTEWFNNSEKRWFLTKGDGRTLEPVDRSPGPGVVDMHGRSKYYAQDWFATFETLAACFAKRAALFGSGPYGYAAQRFKVDGDLPALVKAIAPYYATDPGYADKVLAIIRQADVQAAWRFAEDQAHPDLRAGALQPQATT